MRRSKVESMLAFYESLDGMDPVSDALRCLLALDEAAREAEDTLQAWSLHPAASRLRAALLEADDAS